VREAVVLAREDAAGDKRLIAYVTFKMDLEVAVADLREHLARRLPGYMLPVNFVRLAQLPLSANGKIDRRALAALDADEAPVQSYDAPQGELEQALAAIWSEVLAVERVGRNDDFFELGGHSLLASQIMFRLNQKGRIAVKIRDIFDYPTVASLSKVARRK
jgi:acyl carrier protein